MLLDDDHAESIDSLESSRLSKDLEQARNSLTQKDKEIRGLRDQVQDLERSLRAKVRCLIFRDGKIKQSVFADWWRQGDKRP